MTSSRGSAQCSAEPQATASYLQQRRTCSLQQAGAGTGSALLSSALSPPGWSKARPRAAHLVLPGLLQQLLSPAEQGLQGKKPSSVSEPRATRQLPGLVALCWGGERGQALSSATAGLSTSREGARQVCTRQLFGQGSAVAEHATASQEEAVTWLGISGHLLSAGWQGAGTSLGALSGSPGSFVARLQQTG